MDAMEEMDSLRERRERLSRVEGGEGPEDDGGRLQVEREGRLPSSVRGIKSEVRDEDTRDMDKRGRRRRREEGKDELELAVARSWSREGRRECIFGRAVSTVDGAG